MNAEEEARRRGGGCHQDKGRGGRRQGRKWKQRSSQATAEEQAAQAHLKALVGDAKRKVEEEEKKRSLRPKPNVGGDEQGPEKQTLRPSPLLLRNLEIDGVPHAKRERYLCPEDFEDVFGMSKEDFEHMHQ